MFSVDGLGVSRELGIVSTRSVSAGFPLLLYTTARRALATMLEENKRAVHRSGRDARAPRHDVVVVVVVVNMIGAEDDGDARPAQRLEPQPR